MRLRREAVFWSLLSGLALLTVLANRALEQPLPIATARVYGADHSFSQPQAWLFDRAGRPAYEVRGTSMEHRADDDGYLLHDAELLLHPREGEQGFWRLRAERAELDADRQHARLMGAVTLQREQVPPADALLLEARQVALDLSARTATSQLPMTVTGLHWQSQATAFAADFTQRLLLQEGRVHDRYEPPRR